MNALHSFQLGAGRAAVMFFAVALLSACATAPTAPPAARSELAPTGKLRVGLLVQNPVFVTRDGPVGEMRGVAVELSRELARQLGVTFEPVRYDSIAKLIDGAKTRDWDVAFLGFEQERTVFMDFTAAYLELGNSYLVPAGSQILTIGDVDKPGHRVGVTQRSVQDRYLTKSLKQAQLVRISSAGSEGTQLLSTRKAHAVAGNRVVLLELAAKVPGSRVLDGSFSSARHALAVAKGRPAGTAYAKEFIEHAKASGSVQQAIDRAELRGVNVAARASGM